MERLLGLLGGKEEVLARGMDPEVPWPRRAEDPQTAGVVVPGSGLRTQCAAANARLP